MNQAILIGRLTKEPDLRATESGISVCSFTLAVDRHTDNKADFVPIVVWRNLAEHCTKYLHKGSQVAIRGNIQIRNYTGTDGKKRYVTVVVADEVKFLDKTVQAADENTQMQTIMDEESPF